MKNFFKNLMPMLLLVAGLGISPNAFGEKKNHTIYFAPALCNHSDWTTPWVNYYKDSNGNWNNSAMEDANATYHDCKVFKKVITDEGYNGFNNIQFHKLENNWDNQINGISNWTTFDTFDPDGHICTGADSWTSYSADATVHIYYAASPSANSVKIAVCRSFDDGKAGNFKEFDMTKTDKTYNGNPIWEGSYVTWYGGLGKFEFHVDDSYKALFEGWKSTSVFNPSEKICTSTSDGGTWVTYNYDVTITPSVNSSTMGGVTPSTAQTMLSGASSSFTATANTGYHFVSWSGINVTPTSSSNATQSFTSGSSNGTITATFAANQYTVTLDAKGGTDGTTSVTATYGAAMPSADMPTKTGYTFGGYYDGEDGAGTQYYTSAGASACNWDKASTATLYAKWTEKTHNITISTDGHGTTSPTGTQSNVGEVTGISITATPSTGYNFKEWVVTNGTVTAQEATTTFKPTANGATIQATFSLADVYYDFTYGLCDGMSNYGSVTSDHAAGNYISGTSIKLTASPITGYEVEGWYSAPTGGNKIADGTNPYTISLSDANKSIYVKFKKSTYAITYSPATAPTGCAYTTAPSSAEFESNVTIVVTPTAGYTVTVSSEDADLSQDGNTYTFTMPAKAVAINVSATENKYNVTVDNGNGTQVVQAGVVTHPQITAVDKDDQIFVSWTCTDGASVANESDKTTTVSATATGTVTATYKDKTLVKLYFANYAEWPTVKVYAYDAQGNKNADYPGVLTTEETINCVTYKVFSYYAEDREWETVIFNNGQNDDNCKTEDLTIAGNEGHFYMPNGWMQEPHGVLTGVWQAEPYATLWAFHVKKSGAEHGEDCLVNCENNQATASLEASTHYIFKAHNYVTGKWYGNNNSDSYITETISNWDFWDDANDCNMQTKDAGTYTFEISEIVTSSHIKVSVTYPEAAPFSVAISTDGNGKLVDEDGNEVTGTMNMYQYTGTKLEAIANPGYHFDKWVKSENVHYQNGESETSNPAHFYVGAENQTIQATFAKNTSIYFNNTMQDAWGTDEMYVYFYNNEGYWDDSKGTGSNSTGTAQGGGDFDKSQYFIAGPCKMTKISNTNIWEYAYDPTSITGIKGVVFADSRMENYDYFTQCNATRRMDFKDCANMFVLSSESPKETKNGSANYYSTGFWRGYNSEESKMYMHIRVDADEKYTGEMTAAFVGSDTYSFTTRMEGNKTYNLYIGNCTGMNFSNYVKITSEDCTGIRLYEYATLDNLGWIDAAASGDYTFSLTFDNDKMYLSVEYPITLSDYRVKIGDPVRYSNIIRAAEASGTISMYLAEGNNTLIYENATDVDHTPITWTEGGTIDVNVAKAGVYTMTLTKSGTIDAGSVKPYKGNYFIRTDCAQGGWNEYKTNDNNLMRFTDRNPKFVNKSNEGFNYYYCRWNTNGGGNVRCVVANEINACISDTLKEDAWLDEDEFLKGMANIRFGWNSNTNELSRAYISGAYDEPTYLRIHSRDGNLYEYSDQEPAIVISNKKFKDENDWTYVMDVYANGGSQVAVSAKYNGKYQSFVGSVIASDGDEVNVTASELLLEGGTKQHMRVIYDFKTDRLVAGWMPGGDITDNVVLNADMLLVRAGQGDAAQINITNAGASISKIKTIYAVLQLNRSKMLSNTEGIKVSGHVYENGIYWFSLPFDVKVNDIFGVDGYGTKWVLQYYDGDLRSRIGFFAETETFWTELGINDTVKANVGYALCLDPDYFDDADDAIWANNRQSVSFYFPSVDKDQKIVGNGAKTVPVPEHECTIDRWFGEKSEEFPQGNKNHKITDTDWNVIGSPAFQDLTGTETMCTMHALYQWNSTTNGYNVATVDGFNFLATHAYLVQFHGDIKWQNASVINPTAAAPRYAYADEKNYTIELQFYYGSQWDRTYVALVDNAKADFVLNEDLTKMTNSGQPNIYSYAGAYDVAYNATAFENQTVNLGVIARKNGSYTFAMPKDFSGKAVLVDLESGEATDLNLSNYTVELNKGTYNNRFQLLLEVEAKAPTNMNPTKGEWSEDGKTKKLFINDNIYLINAGRIYNVLGVGE